jgi:hypothetical protein
MKTIRLQKMIGGALLAFSLLFGIVIASSTTARAQYPNWPYGQDRRDRRDDRYRNRDRNDRYRDRNARNRNRDYRYDDRTYNNGVYGNNGVYTNNGWYNRSQDNYSNYGGSSQFRQTALNAGYNEGLKAGREDRQRGEGYEFRDESAFRNGDKDYNSRYGDRELYRQYFREAFQNGYADGYRGY